jgi:hypothetical protein
MSVRAKFYVNSITPTVGDNPTAPARVLSFGAVCRGASNREWSSATPSGSLTMTVRNDAAIAQFEVGKEYYLTFEPAEPKPVAGDGHEAQPGMTGWGVLACEACGMGGSWVADGTNKYVWDDAAQARHDEAYGAA